MKKSITLKQFVESCPNNLEKEYCHRIPDNFKELPYTEKFKCYNDPSCYNRKLSLFKKDNKVFVFSKNTKIKRVGKNIFTQTTSETIIAIVDNKIVKSSINSEQLIDLLNLLNITTSYLEQSIEDKCYFATSSQIISNKIILRKILTGRIYNEETLYKSIAFSIYKFKPSSWKNVKEYLKLMNPRTRRYMSLYDLRDFTKDINKSINVILNADDYSIYADLLACAIMLNQVVDFSWSEKRIYEEHKKQNNLLRELEIKNKKVIPIYDGDFNNSNINLLNTELEIFKEGYNMHHCLYTCYYSKIKNGEYMAFHMSSPEDCTFGVYMKNGVPLLDQIFLAYDKPVKPSTREIAEKFIDSNKDKIKFMMGSINKNINTELDYLSESVPMVDDLSVLLFNNPSLYN